jgi:hypothetical protein
MLALTPKEIVNLKQKGVIIEEFQKWRRILLTQSKRVNHRLNLNQSNYGKK